MTLPTNPTRLRYRRHCGHKHRHTSKGKAEAAMRGLYRRGLAKDGTLEVYACAYGAHWHVGHREGA